MTTCLEVFLAFASSTVVWMLCIAIPILAALLFLFLPVIVLAIWASVSGPVSDAAFEMVANAVIVLVALALTPAMSMAIVRLSLRISPLPVGYPARFRLAPHLWLSWLLVFSALAASGSEPVTLVVAGIVAVCSMRRVYRVTHDWQGAPRGRTVLFLRRFGYSADRLVSTAIRRAVPEGTCLAFLIGRRQSAASWDPLVVAFDGLSRRGLPLYLQSTDDEWVGHVREMVLQADAVVLDATDWSDAMDTELAIVDSCAASNRLTILVRQDHQEQSAVAARRQLRYRVSWRQASHRMFWGFMFTLVPAVIGAGLGWSLTTRVVVTLPAVLAWLLLAVRPLMDEAATRELADRLTGPDRHQRSI